MNTLERNHPFYKHGLRDGVRATLILAAFWWLIFYLIF